MLALTSTQSMGRGCKDVAELRPQDVWPRGGRVVGLEGEHEEVKVLC